MFQSTSAVKTIFYLNLATFLLTLAMPSFIYEFFAMWSFTNNYFQIHQLVTYQFLHSGVLHLVFNMLVLLSFGPSIEDHFGTKKLWIYYLLCGISGAVLHTLMIPSDLPMVGASGSIWGIMMMFVFLYPNEKLYLFFIPVGIKAKYIIWGMLLFEIVSTMLDRETNVSHYGHIGGALMGVLLFLGNKYKVIK